MRRFWLFLGALVGTFVQADVLAQTPAAPASVLIPIEHFTKFDEFGGVKISPDGEFIAVLTGKYGRSTVLFVDLKNKKKYRAFYEQYKEVYNRVRRPAALQSAGGN